MPPDNRRDSLAARQTQQPQTCTTVQTRQHALATLRWAGEKNGKGSAQAMNARRRVSMVLLPPLREKHCRRRCHVQAFDATRSEERRVGKGGVSTCKSRWGR